MSDSICTFPGCDRELHGHGYCKTHRQQQRRGKPLTPIARRHGSIPLAERFWSKVDDRGPGCWLWCGNVRGEQGYGVIGINNKNYYAHRISWELTHGMPPAEGSVIDHICFNRLCVNPDHLRETTSQLNGEYRRRGNTPLPSSGIRGVYPIRDKWMARLKHQGVVYNLGHYADKEEAGRVVAAKREELFGFPEFQGQVK